MNPKEKVRVQVAEEWMNYGDEDLRLARHAMTLSSSIPFRLIAFHAQQCAEKYLKAYLVCCGVDFPYTHDIAKLLKWCGEVDWKKKLTTADELTPYAVTARYPGIRLAVSKQEAMKAIRTASRVQRVVRRELEKKGLAIPQGSD